jgi:hypothetical protein
VLFLRKLFRVLTGFPPPCLPAGRRGNDNRAFLDYINKKLIMKNLKNKSLGKKINYEKFKK